MSLGVDFDANPRAVPIIASPPPKPTTHNSRIGEISGDTDACYSNDC
jgi:hypothetical protein